MSINKSKKILFASYSLDIGGIESALVTLVNKLASKNYEVTLVLEKKSGIFLNDIDSKIKILEYSPDSSNNKIISKLKNGIKRLKFFMKYKNKFDFSCSFATYSLPASFIARIASKNNALWVHSDYYAMNNNNIKLYKEFFKKISANNFKNVIFVSESSKLKYIEIMNQNIKNNIYTINNLIDYDKILRNSKEKISDIQKEQVCTFLYVGRFTENDKKISRLIESAKLLVEENLKFRIIMIGDGKELDKYTKTIKQYKLDNIILILGKKKNPYPYFKISDYLVLTSDNEGFPVVYIESMVLGLPIITTNVSDSEKIINNKYGVVIDKSIKSVYQAMKKAIEDGYDFKEKFNPEQYNSEILNKIEKIINGENYEIS